MRIRDLLLRNLWTRVRSFNRVNPDVPLTNRVMTVQISIPALERSRVTTIYARDIIDVVSHTRRITTKDRYDLPLNNKNAEVKLQVIADRRVLSLGAVGMTYESDKPVITIIR